MCDILAERPAGRKYVNFGDASCLLIISKLNFINIFLSLKTGLKEAE